MCHSPRVFKEASNSSWFNMRHPASPVWNLSLYRLAGSGDAECSVFAHGIFLAGSCQERGLLCEDHHQQTYRRHEEDKRDLWLKTTYIRNMAAIRRNTNGAKKSAENHMRNLHIGGRKKTPSQISRTILRHSTLTSRPPSNRFSRVTNRGMAFPKG
jgi:hypothetical protein